MPFFSTGAFTTFTANTKAKSAEVNANFAACVAFFNTTTSDVLVGSVWQKVASTAASHTLTASDSIQTLLVNVNTSAGYTVTLPTASANTNRLLTIKHIGATTGTLTIDGAGSETIDGATTLTLPKQYDSVKLHCDGSNWHAIDRSYEVQPGAVSGLVHKNGLRGNEAAAAIASGYVGEVTSTGQIGTAVSVGTGATTLGQLSNLPPGKWTLYAHTMYSGGAGVRLIDTAINNAAATMGGATFGVDRLKSFVDTTNGEGGGTTIVKPINISATTTYYVICVASAACGAGAVTGSLIAIRNA